jgi:competence protein ComEA
VNRVLASFTKSERSIIAFVLMLVGCGFGLQQWAGRGKSAMVFSVEDHPKMATTSMTPKGLTSDGRININTADPKMLETLPGVGPSMAGAISRQRTAVGAFASLADLDSVPGVGPAMLAKLAPMVEFGASTTITKLAVQPPIANASNIPAVQTIMPVGAAGAANGPVNINTANLQALDTLIGVGPALAQRIVFERQQHGPFSTVESLARVKGIGAKVIQKNRDRLKVQ